MAVVIESDFPVYTWTVARPLANSILTLSLVNYSLGAANIEMSLLDTDTAPETDSDT